MLVKRVKCAENSRLIFLRSDGPQACFRYLDSGPTSLYEKPGQISWHFRKSAEICQSRPKSSLRFHCIGPHFSVSEHNQEMVHNLCKASMPKILQSKLRCSCLNSKFMTNLKPRNLGSYILDLNTENLWWIQAILQFSSNFEKASHFDVEHCFSNPQFFSYLCFVNTWIFAPKYCINESRKKWRQFGIFAQNFKLYHELKFSVTVLGAKIQTGEKLMAYRINKQIRISLLIVF